MKIYHLPFLIPLTSASLLSTSCEISEIIPFPASTVLGPPYAYTPVYKDLSSWNLFASATVPENTGPPVARIFLDNAS